MNQKSADARLSDPERRYAAALLGVQNFPARPTAAQLDELVAAIRTRAKEDDRGIAIFDEFQIISILGKLGPRLRPEQIKLAVLRMDQWGRVKAIEEIAEYLSPPVLSDLLKAIEDEWDRSDVIESIVPKMAPDQTEALWDVAQEIEHYQDKWRAFEALLPRLPIPKFIEALQGLDDDGERMDAIQTLVDEYDSEHVSAAFQVAQTIKNEDFQWLAIEALADKDEIADAFIRILRMEAPRDRAMAFVGLAPVLTEGQLKRVLSDVETIDDTFGLATALGCLAPHLVKSPRLFNAALKKAIVIEDDVARGAALQAFAPYFPPDADLRKALSAAEAISDPWVRVTTIETLARRLPIDERAAVINRTIETVAEIQGDKLRARALKHLRPHLRNNPNIGAAKQVSTLTSDNTVEDSTQQSSNESHEMKGRNETRIPVERRRLVGTEHSTRPSAAIIELGERRMLAKAGKALSRLMPAEGNEEGEIHQLRVSYLQRLAVDYSGFRGRRSHSDRLQRSPGQIDVRETSQIDEGLLSDARSANRLLKRYLTARGIPEEEHATYIARIDQMLVVRPKWDDRHKYEKLGHLNAPRFLRAVYSEAIDTEGRLTNEEVVRLNDPSLVRAVQGYINNRIERRLPLGDAEGLVFTKKDTRGRPPKRPGRRKGRLGAPSV